MRYKVIILLLICSSVFCFAGQAEKDKNNSYLKKMFSYANERNENKLRDIHQSLPEKHDRILDIGYWYAQYILNPQGNKERFIVGFPEDTEGINSIYEIEKLSITPKFMYAIDSLGEFALSGNKIALRKLFIGILHSDAGVAEKMADYIAKTINLYPKEAIIEIGQFNKEDRFKIYTSFEVTYGKDDISSLANKLKKMRFTVPKEKQLADEMMKYLSTIKVDY